MQVKREGFHVRHTEQLYHGEKKGWKLLMTCSHTTFGSDRLRSLIWEGPSWLHLLNRGPCGRALRWFEVLLMVLFVTLHSGTLSSLPFSRSLCMLAEFLVEIFTRLLLICCGQCVLIRHYQLVCIDSALPLNDLFWLDAIKITKIVIVKPDWDVKKGQLLCSLLHLVKFSVI